MPAEVSPEKSDDLVGRLIQEQCRQWREGKPLPVEAYLEQYSSLQSDTEAILQLVESECLLREERGETPSLEEYTARFPTLAKDLALQFEVHGFLGPVTLEGESATLRLPELPGYEALTKLGEGGMGVVYKAWQTALKRWVAIKLVRADRASSDFLFRFQREAEALGRLKHPNVVPVHEYGEHEGQPFMVMEFVEGITLQQKLDDDGPLPARESASLLETLARGVHVAHTHGLIHRDLKPDNVLLAADGSVKISDFGLARHDQRDVSSGAGLAFGNEPAGLSEGQVMGTPAYMAPEQIYARHGSIGPQTDVFALGGILHVVLTGRLPCPASLEWLISVGQKQRKPPSEYQRGLDRDLEAICLKCLAWDCANRYASALELAEDLGRYQRGEPIHARSIGKLERLRKWARRRPALAGFLIALNAVAGVSIALAVVAWEKAEQKRKDNIALQDKEAGLRRSVVQGWLRAFAKTVEPWRKAPVADPEIGTVWEMAEKRSDDLGPLFVKESLRTPQTTRQLRIRADLALHAAVGLNLHERREVEQLLEERLQDPGLDSDEQTDLAILVAALGQPPARTAGLAGKLLAQAMARRTKRNPEIALMQLLWAESDGTKTIDAEIALSQAITVVAPQLERADAEKIADTLAQAMPKPRVVDIGGRRRPWVAPLLAVVARMEPSRAADTINSAMAVAPSAELHLWAEGLAALAPRLKADEAVRACNAAGKLLARNLTDYAGTSIANDSADGLALVAGYMEPSEAVKAYAGTARAIIARITGGIGSGDTGATVAILVRITPHLQPVDARASWSDLADGLLKKMAGASDWELSGLSKALEAAAAHMEPTQGARACNRGVDVLAQRITSPKISSYSQREPAAALGLLVRNMEPNQAAEVLARTMAATKDLEARGRLAEALSAVTRQMMPADATRLCGPPAAEMAQKMTANNTPLELKASAQAISALAARLEAAQANGICGQAAKVLTEAIAKPGNRNFLRPLAEGLAAAATGLDSANAARALDTAADALSRAWTAATGPNDSNLRISLAQALSAVAARMDPARGGERLSSAISQTTEQERRSVVPTSLDPLAEGLSTVSVCMEPAQAARTIIQAMTVARKRSTLRVLANTLAAVAARMRPSQGARASSQAADILIQAMDRDPFAYSLRASAEALAAVAARMEPAQAAKVCTQATNTLTRALTQGNYGNVLDLAEGLSVVSIRAERAAVALACTRAVEALARVEAARAAYHDGGFAWEQELTRSAKRLASDRPGSNFEGTISAILSESRFKNTYLDEVAMSLARCVATLAPRMEAAKAADLLALAMAHTQNPFTLRVLAEGLTAVLTNTSVANQTTRSTATGAVVGFGASVNAALAIPVALSPALEPLPCSFSTQELVELLKRPLFIGPARRVVLAQLENRYRRKFIDHWEFVRFADKQKLGLDFTTPPQRLETTITASTP